MLPRASLMRSTQALTSDMRLAQLQEPGHTHLLSPPESLLRLLVLRGTGTDAASAQRSTAAWPPNILRALLPWKQQLRRKPKLLASCR